MRKFVECADLSKVPRLRTTNFFGSMNESSSPSWKCSVLAQSFSYQPHRMARAIEWK